MKRIRSAFVTGLLVLVPLMATIDILGWLIRTVDHSVRQYFPSGFPFDLNGFGVLSALLIIFLTGLLTQNYMGTWLIKLFDSFMRRITIVGGIYGAIKKFLETILNPGSDQFKEAVLVEFPRVGCYSIGFRTGRPDPKLTRDVKKPLVNVFVPCTPNPTSGFYLLIPEDQLIPLQMPVQEAFKIIISMGIVTSEENGTAKP